MKQSPIRTIFPTLSDTRPISVISALILHALLAASEIFTGNIMNMHSTNIPVSISIYIGFAFYCTECSNWTIHI